MIKKKGEQNKSKQRIRVVLLHFFSSQNYFFIYVIILFMVKRARTANTKICGNFKIEKRKQTCLLLGHSLLYADAWAY